MKSFAVLVCVLALLCSANAIPTIISTGVDCLNGISCAPGQTCMSNTTGVGMAYSCSPLPNAVRCMDARFSCPASTICAEELKCVAVDGSVSDGVLNVDAFAVAESRDFGKGMQLMSRSICGAIANSFRLPNFCRCNEAPLGGELTCQVGLGNIISIGASAFIFPCGTPASLGYRAWASLLGMSRSIGRTWTAAFSMNMDIPGASFGIPIATLTARAEISGEISGGVAAARLNIGACGCAGIWRFKKCWCNPTGWLPVRIIEGRADFRRLC